MTQRRLKELLHYNKDTGVFIWKTSPNWSIPIGRVAGSDNGDGYTVIGIDGNTYKAHRLVFLYLYGQLPKEQVDHINGVKDDNRLCNLREVSNRENTLNQKLRSTNTSGVVGVHWHIGKSKWCAKIGKKHLGTYIDKRQAIDARKVAEVTYGYHKNHGRKNNE